MTHSVIQGTLAAAIATGGTLVVSYPTGKTAGDFKQGPHHEFICLQTRFKEGQQTNPVSFAFNAANVTMTYNGTTTLPAGSQYFMQLDEPGHGSTNVPFVERSQDAQVRPLRITDSRIYRIDLGAPATADVDAISTVANSTVTNGTVNLTINGVFASNVSGANVATMDVPRAVSITSDANMAAVTFTVYGYDEYNAALVENITGPNNTTGNGKKAFKRVTRVASNANTTNVSVGSSDVLGLPVWLPGSAAAFIIRELMDGATVTAGTAVAGLATGTASSITSADVRGTYDPNSACNGTLSFALDVALPDPTFLGNPQYAG